MEEPFLSPVETRPKRLTYASRGAGAADNTAIEADARAPASLRNGELTNLRHHPSPRMWLVPATTPSPALACLP